MNILAIGAHPDDLETFCGGTLARFTAQGERVIMCSATDGRAHPLGDPVEIASLRRSEGQAAARLIGAEWSCLEVPDGELKEDFETKMKFVDAIRAATPDVIITHPPEDYHADHVHTSRLVMEALQAAWAPNLPSDLPPFQKPVPVAFMPNALGINFIPEDYVDISEVYPAKIQMVLQHRSQYLDGPPYTTERVGNDFDQYYIVRIARVMSEFYGLSCGVPYAEAFRWWRAADRLLTRRMLP